MNPSIHVGTRKGLFTVCKAGARWEIANIAHIGEPVTMLLPRPKEGFTLACLTLGHFGTKLRRRDANTDEWKELGVPVFPQGATIPAGQPTGDEPVATKPASLSEIWSLEVGGENLSDVLWAGTIPGGLFRSDDAGESWQLVSSLWNKPERFRWFGGGKDDAGIHSICVDPRDSNRVTIGISSGGVWQTADAGHSWENVGQGLRAEYLPPNLQYDIVSQDPHRLVQCPTQPDIFWIQHHNGIFRSTDGAKTFTEILTAKPSSFGFAVVVHPKDPDTAWFVPAQKDQYRIPVDGRMVVSRTRDGGRTFDVLSKGLPDRHAYDIVFRHALDIDSTGELLAMGSSTGGLWVSEDGGESWDLISHTLPPIYTVRIA